MFHTQRGKWGMASFTSTRTIGKRRSTPFPASDLNSISGFLGKIPGQGNTSFAYENPDEANAVPTIAAAATTPKPRKFFKSRAAANQETQPIAQQQQETYASQVAVAQEAPAPPPAKQKTKQSKKKHQEFVPPAVQPAPEPEPALYIPQPSVSQDRIRETIPSKRYLARSRKVQVNYNEDESSLPAPVQTVQPPPPQAVPAAMTVPISAVSPSMEHPPIVLRISKVSRPTGSFPFLPLRDISNVTTTFVSRPIHENPRIFNGKGHLSTIRVPHILPRHPLPHLC